MVRQFAPFLSRSVVLCTRQLFPVLPVAPYHLSPWPAYPCNLPALVRSLSLPHSCRGIYFHRQSLLLPVRLILSLVLYPVRTERSLSDPVRNFCRPSGIPR